MYWRASTATQSSVIFVKLMSHFLNWAETERGLKKKNSIRRNNSSGAVSHTLERMVRGGLGSLIFRNPSLAPLDSSKAREASQHQ